MALRGILLAVLSLALVFAVLEAATVVDATGESVNHKQLSSDIAGLVSRARRQMKWNGR
jgi:hypothetical protein